MHRLPEYPLKQVLEVKKNRVEKAEKVVNEKKKALEIEEEKLQKIVKERDLVLDHHNDKLTQQRKALDEGTTSPEIQQMKAYLKVVKEKLKKEEAKVKQQQDQVTNAKKNLETARQDWLLKRKEAEKIELHKEQWEKEANIEFDRKQTAEQDEVGTVIHQANKRKKNRE